MPLEVTREQVTYFAPPAPELFGADRLPVWIWMDDPSFYGFPCYGEATVKAARRHKDGSGNSSVPWMYLSKK